jgi:NAD(P)-dependent dehydrogenase (short-subunit alcohol dehydrogenase family)
MATGERDREEGRGMVRGLQGRTALVTGASRGIGLACARALAAEGAWVGMVARSRDTLAGLAAEIGGHAIPADLASPTAVHTIATYLDEVLGGGPDILVSAAGVFSLVPIARTEPADFARHLTVNLQSPFLLVRAFLPRMLERRSGHIVNVGSVAGRVALPGNGSYSASKYGLRGLHEVLAEEIRGTGVRATLIEPAATDTSLWDPLDPDSRADLPSRSRMLRPEDVARAVVYAVSQPEGVEISVLALRAAN